MAIDYEEALARLISYFANHFGMPESYFDAATSLQDDLLYDAQSLVAVGKYINQAHWTPVYVYPREIAACETIDDVAKLASR